jgi:hypothetical protein
MAFAAVIGKGMFVVVIVMTAYAARMPTDYPNLAGKVELLPARELRGQEYVTSGGYGSERVKL